MSIRVTDLEYRCRRFVCAFCGIQMTDGITTEMIYSEHGRHLEMVDLEIEIVPTGEIWVLQPIQPNSC